MTGFISTKSWIEVASHRLTWEIPQTSCLVGTEISQSFTLNNQDFHVKFDPRRGTVSLEKTSAGSSHVRTNAYAITSGIKSKKTRLEFNIKANEQHRILSGLRLLSMLQSQEKITIVVKLDLLEEITRCLTSPHLWIINERIHVTAHPLVMFRTINHFHHKQMLV